MRRLPLAFALFLIGAAGSALLLSARSGKSRAAPAVSSPATAGLVGSGARATVAAISEADLESRVYIFADDSMQGRRAGSPGHDRATSYIVHELGRLGLQPGGENGTYFQRVRVRADNSDSAWSRNVIAILPGSDPLRREQYVALGAHSDHIGFRAGGPVDHDSLRAFDRAVWVARGRTAGAPPLSRAAERALSVDVAALRRVRAPRPDSINNGADDDGSGAMALLELAEEMVAAPTPPRRSVLFVWHTGEEIDLNGSREFTEHPTVPLRAIVAQINIDMIGRGSAADLASGGPNYLSIIGPRRLSSELARWVDAVNDSLPIPFALDYSLDADRHPEAIYCRSDHWMYARQGIPIVFMFTNLHEDYHEVTDEAQYIDYPHLTRVTHFVSRLVRFIADHAQPPRVDRPAPSLNVPCTQ